MTAKIAKNGRKEREEEPARTFSADLQYIADVTRAERPLRLVVAEVADGWLCAAVYPDTKESITLAVYPDIERAKTMAEGGARVVHNVRDAIEWIPGKAAGENSRELRAKSQFANADFR